jgi:aubergine-like protein
MGPNSTFEQTSGGITSQVTFKDYLRNKWNRTVLNENQPLLVSQRKRGRGGRNDEIYLVPEFCRETGLTDELRSGFFMMKLGKYIRPSAEERINRYKEFLTNV